MTAPAPDFSFSDWEDDRFERELERVTLGSEDRGIDEPIDDLELVAAAVHLAALGPLEEPPASLMERIRAQALPTRSAEGESGLRALPSTLDAGTKTSAPGRSTSAPARGAGVLAWAGWVVAAGVLAVLLLRGGGPDPRLERESLLAVADALQLDWTATEDPYAGSVSGDVVWSNERQRGFMRFRDLAQNDPAELQYQLWIFDAARPESPPIDGGLFDVPAGEEVIVPIDAQIPVGSPKLFAVTVEKPGGVVVSAQEHIIVVADPTKS